MHKLYAGNTEPLSGCGSVGVLRMMMSKRRVIICCNNAMLLACAMMTFLVGAVYAQAQCSKSLSALYAGSPGMRLKSIEKLYSGDRKSIAHMIKHVDENREGPFGLLTNPRESVASVRPVYCGIIAAYMIELILGKESLALTPEMDFFLGRPPDNYIYRFNIVTYVENNESIRRRDLGELKSIYTNWWMRNRTKSMKELRSMWRNGDRPLVGTRYKWE